MGARLGGRALSSVLQIKGPLPRSSRARGPTGCIGSRIGAPVRSSEPSSSAGSGPLSCALSVWGPGRGARCSRRQQRSVLAARPGASRGPLGAAGRGPRAGVGAARAPGSGRAWQAEFEESKTKQPLTRSFLFPGAPGLSRGLPGFQLPIQLFAGDLRARRARTAGWQLGRETLGLGGSASGHPPFIHTLKHSREPPGACLCLGLLGELKRGLQPGARGGGTQEDPFPQTLPACVGAGASTPASGALGLS